jgi:peroxiredoxin
LTLLQQLNAAADQLWLDRPAADRRRFEDALEALRHSDLLREPVQCGEMVPDFSLFNALGEPVGLEALLDAGPLVLTFILSAECRLCRLAVHAYREALSRSDVPRDGGLFVSLEPAAEAALKLPQGDIASCLLGDPDGRVCRLFGLLYEPSEELRDGFRQLGMRRSLLEGLDARLPLVATYVINSDGIAAFAEIDADPCRRAEPADVIAALQRERPTIAPTL